MERPSGNCLPALCPVHWFCVTMTVAGESASSPQCSGKRDDVARNDVRSVWPRLPVLVLRCGNQQPSSHFRVGGGGFVSILALVVRNNPHLCVSVKVPEKITRYSSYFWLDRLVIRADDLATEWESYSRNICIKSVSKLHIYCQRLNADVRLFGPLVIIESCNLCSVSPEHSEGTMSTAAGHIEPMV